MKKTAILSFHAFLFSSLFIILSFCSSVALAHPDASICSSPYELPNNQWRQIALPCLPPAGSNQVSSVFADDLSGVNGTDWALYQYHPNTNTYSQLALSDTLLTGVGYWIIQLSGNTVTLDMPDGSTPSVDSAALPACTSSRCTQVNLAAQPGTFTWQMLGFSYPETVDLANFRVTGTSCDANAGCTLTEANATQQLSDIFYSYNGSAYNILNKDGFISPWTGFWAASLNNAQANNSKLLMPHSQLASSQYAVLAANDLGMHCADLDHQIFSILPPFNVVHAQVIEKGNTPRILDDNTVSVRYSSAANPADPAGTSSINTTSENNFPSVFKSTFWDQNAAGSATVGGQAYGPLYPGVNVLSLLGGPDLSGSCADPTIPAGCPSALTLFELLAINTGIPVPDGNALYPENPATAPLLVTNQQKMPGSTNTPQDFLRYDANLPFFVNFDFGFRDRNVNWFAADGIPMSSIDDTGKRNPYPLMKISAQRKSDNKDLHSIDVVLPIAAEADCHNCHADPIDCNDSALPVDSRTTECLGAAIDGNFIVATLDDNPPGANRLEQLRNAAKINILRLHDAKHGADYKNWDNTGTLVAAACNPQVNPNSPNCIANQTPIQCSRCHYSPALDLTQGGPVNEPEQGVTGRQQVLHASMSQVMHKFHGTLPAFQGQALFPAMPGPVGRSAQTTRQVLNQTCYQCHPGKLTNCLRGAMAAGGVVCQDCHGDMEQVGTDFTLRVSSQNPGDFVLDGSLRVPWASEPKCQSCHTGDALNPNHPANSIIASDGIRLLQAYKTETLNVPNYAQPAKVATINASPNSRFAENQATNQKGNTVDVLYRLSKGHGGVMCEGCHGSTHAIYPNPNPNANDNVASSQLQGHRGSIIECNTCHTTDLGVTLEGPHGMHPVGGTSFANGGHEDLAENNPNACRACHGDNGQGTVLSKVAVNRSFVIEECEGGSLCPGNNEVKNLRVTLQKGTQVRCDLCHENKL